MNIIPTPLRDCLIIENKVFTDPRGFFLESFNQKRFNENLGQNYLFVQDNMSYSEKGTLRGLHYQKGEFAQTKLVMVVSGKVMDVVVDLRKNSPSFAQHICVELSAENKRQLLVPKGFAHGFIVLSAFATFLYKCDAYYAPTHESGIIFNDTFLNINWGLNPKEIIVSTKDLLLPPFDFSANYF